MLQPLILGFSSGSQGTLQLGNKGATGSLEVSEIRVGNGKGRLVFNHNEAAYYLPSIPLHVNNRDFSIEHLGNGKTIFDQSILNSRGSLLVKGGTFQLGRFESSDPSDQVSFTLENTSPESIRISYHLEGTQDRPIQQRGRLHITENATVSTKGGVWIENGFLDLEGRLDASRYIRLGDDAGLAGTLTIANTGWLKAEGIYLSYGSALRLETGSVLELQRYGVVTDGVIPADNGTIYLNFDETYDIPFAFTNVNFTIQGTGKIRFLGDYPRASRFSTLNLQSGSVTFGSAGGPVLTEGSRMVIDSAPGSESLVRIENGHQLYLLPDRATALYPTSLLLASRPGSKARLELDGGDGPLPSRLDSPYTAVGYLGEGELHITNGGILSGKELILAHTISLAQGISMLPPQGSFFMEGAESRSTFERVSIGAAGIGNLTIEGGRFEVADQLILAEMSYKGVANVILSGPQSELTASRLEIWGRTNISISDGAKFEVGTFMNDRDDVNPRGKLSVTVSGPGSLLSFGQGLSDEAFIFRERTGGLTRFLIEAGGTIFSNGATTLGIGPDFYLPHSQIEIAIDGPGSLWEVGGLSIFHLQPVPVISHRPPASATLLLTDGGKLKANYVFIDRGNILQIGKDDSGAGTIEALAFHFQGSQLVFDHNEADFEFAAEILGGSSNDFQIVHKGSGKTTLNGSIFQASDIIVAGGTLHLGRNIRGPGLITVKDGATLSGTTHSELSLLVEDGGRLSPGNSPGVFSVQNLTLEDGAYLDWDANEADHDLFVVNGNLEINGIINIIGDAADIDGRRLFTYTGELMDRTLEINIVSDPSLNRANLSIDLSQEGEVRLTIDHGVVIQQWDGPDSGIWDSVTPNWNNDGSTDVWQEQVGLFGGPVGQSVQVAGDVGFEELQFETDGYHLTDAGGSLVLAPSAENELWVATDVHATISAEITGDGILWKTGLGTLVLAGPNTYTGGTRLDTGTLSISSEESLGTGDFILEGGILKTTAGFSFQRDVYLDFDGGGFETDADAPLTLAGRVTGSGELEKLGEGELILTNADNDYTGGTRFTGGVLSVAQDEALGALSGGLTFDGGTLKATASFATDRETILEEGGGTFEIAPAAILLHTAAISGEGTLTKTGTGTLTLAGELTYTGGTSIQAGILRAGSAGAFDWQNIAIATGAQWDLDGFDQRVSTISGNGGITLGTATLTLESPEAFTFAGTISGEGGVEIRNSFAEFTGTNTYSGGTRLYQSMLTLSSNEALGAPEGRIELDDAILSITAGLTIHRRIVLEAGGGAIDTQETLISTGGIEGSGTLFKLGEGTLVLGGNNRHQGGTFVATGELWFANADALRGDLALWEGTALRLHGFNQQLGTLTGSGSVFMDGATLTLAGGVEDYAFEGRFLGEGNLVKTGQGILQLSGENLHQGETIVKEGTLLAGASMTLSPHSTLTIESGAAVNLNGFHQTIRALKFQNAARLSIGATALEISSGLIDVENGVAHLYDGLLQTPGDFNKTGAGTLHLHHRAEIAQAAILQAGTLIVDGYLGAHDGVFIHTGAWLRGNGVIEADLTNRGTIAPGSSPGVLWIDGDFQQDAQGRLIIEVASASNHDALFINGYAHLGGTLEITGYDGYQLRYGDQFNFLLARSFTGEFNAIEVPGGIRPRLISPGGSLTLLIAPESYTLVARDRNQFNVAKALDSFIPAQDGDRYLVSRTLDSLTEDQYPTAFNAILPGFYDSLTHIGVEQAFNQGQRLQQRFRLLQLGVRGFSPGNLDGPRWSDPKSEATSESGKDILVASRENPWGVWMQGNGLFSRDATLNSLPRYDLNSGGALLGLDYRWNESFTTGLYSGYQRVEARYENQARADMDSARFGVYAAYGKQEGFFANTAIGGGYTFYKVERPIRFATIHRLAESEPEGADFEALLNLGHNWQLGNFNLGLVATGQYTYLGLSSFTEEGAESLNLRLEDQHTHSLRTLLGGQIAYIWQVSPKIVVIPQANLYWQHEFLQDSHNIRAALDGGNGATFDYASNATNRRDSLYGGGGVAVRFGERWSVSTNYQASINNHNFLTHMVSAGLEWRW